MRIVTCSNSAARVSSVNGLPDIVPAGPGGVTPMVAALMRRYGGDWLFVAPEGWVWPRESVVIGGVPIALHAHPLDPVRGRQHHVQISIEILQWLFHYLHETSTTPLFDLDTWAAWEGYCEVNADVARRLTELCRGDHDEVIFVNDHQFLLVPEFLRATGSPRRGPLVYFHQLPWCQSDYFAMLPQRIRTRILSSLLGCDVVGFHARRWADAFLQCCERFLADVDVRGSHVVFRDRKVNVVVAPGPVDEPALARIRADPATDRWREKLARRADGRRILVRAERFDLWKNVGRGLSAYERLLEQFPPIARDTWFCALLSPPRRATARHHRDRERCEAIVARINDRFGESGRQPVELLFAQPHDNSQHRVVAALEMAAATLVNPTYDGLNLVAMESLLLAPAAPVVLSVNAGVHDVLAPYVLDVDPFDIVATTNAIAVALESSSLSGGQWPGGQIRSAEAWLRELLA